MQLNNIQPAQGAKHAKRRVGRGIGSGLGKTAGRGHKGQKSRAGGFHKVGFEGGQMPLLRRIPKSGFSNRRFRTVYEWTNVSILDKHFENGTEVTPELLVRKRLVKKGDLVKVLGDGVINKKLTVRAHSFSGSAKEKIEKAGGKAELIVETKPEARQKSVQ